MSEDFSFEGQLLTNMRRLKEILPCCPNCDHWRWIVGHGQVLSDGAVPTKNEYCDLAPDAGLPPPRIIAFGCPKFEPGIPF